MDKNQLNTSEIPILVSWFMTPLAVATVIAGVVFGRPDPVVGGLSIMIILMSSLMNVASVLLLKQSPDKVMPIVKLRVGLNYAANFFLIYLLLPFWPDIWLLVLLMSVATGIYRDLKSTLLHCAVFGLVLIGLAWYLEELYGIKVGQMWMHLLTIFCFGPFINQVVHSESR